MTPSRQANGALPSALSAQSVTASSTYNGLFYQDDAVRLTSAGSFTLSVTPRGRYSGRIQIGTKRYSFSGLLDRTRPAAPTSSTRHNGPAFTLDFHIGTNAECQSSHRPSHRRHLDGHAGRRPCRVRQGEHAAIRRQLHPGHPRLRRQLLAARGRQFRHSESEQRRPGEIRRHPG